MKTILKQLSKLVFIFFFSGFVYYMIEIIYRGRSYMSMAILGGFAGLVIAYLNDIYSYELDFLLQIGICSIFCTAGEFLVGITLNSNHTIWDYRGLWGTFGYEQLNIIFIGAWIFICALSIPLLDYIEWKFFNAPKPYYKVFGKLIIGQKGE